MGQQFSTISERLRDFIEAQQIFFVATAAPDGCINLSPKGMDSLRVLAPDRVVWLNLTGSGNETAAHLLESPRMTLMLTAFTGPPMILRIYGRATTVHPCDAQWPLLASLFPAHPGARQIFDLSVERVQTSCGMAVPLYDFVGERLQLNEWAAKKGEDGVRDYWQQKNQLSIDGRPTGMP